MHCEQLIKEGYQFIGTSKNGDFVYKLTDGCKRVFKFVKEGIISPKKIEAQCVNINGSVKYSHAKTTQKLNAIKGFPGNEIEVYNAISDGSGLTIGKETRLENPYGRITNHHGICVTPNYNVKFARTDKIVVEKSPYNSWTSVPSCVRAIENTSVINNFKNGHSSFVSYEPYRTKSSKISTSMPRYSSFKNALNDYRIFSAL